MNLQHTEERGTWRGKSCRFKSILRCQNFTLVLTDWNMHRSKLSKANKDGQEPALKSSPEQLRAPPTADVSKPYHRAHTSMFSCNRSPFKVMSLSWRCARRLYRSQHHLKGTEYDQERGNKHGHQLDYSLTSGPGADN